MSETHKPSPRVVLEWDLSESHRIADVGWQEDLSRSQRFWKGDIDLTLKLAGGVLRSELADVRADREGDDVHVLQLRGHPRTLDEAFTEVERRIEELKLPRRDLDQWREDARSGDFKRKRAFATRRNDLTPAVSLEIRPAYDDDRPWYLSWEITWPSLEATPDR